MLVAFDPNVSNLPAPPSEAILEGDQRTPGKIFKILNTAIQLQPQKVSITFQKRYTMKRNTWQPRLWGWILTFGLLTALHACSDDEPAVEPEQPEESTEAPDAYQDKIRTMPYPKESNELMVNPAPFIVPESMKTDERLQFALSTDADFAEADTEISEPQAGCFYNLHRALDAGTWYWRFRSTAADGSNPGDWSETYSFEVKAETPVFVTPPFSDFLSNAPRIHPRLYCFLNPTIDQARKDVTSHAEYRQLTARAATALQTDYTTMDLYANAETLRQQATWLYHAYYLTQDGRYADKLEEMLDAMAATPPTDAQLFTDNFTASNITLCHAAPYDLLYDRLTADQRTAAETLMMRTARYYYNENCGYQENHIFDNHFWQQNMRILTQAAFLLYDKTAYADEILPILEYYYELWTARAPAGGFNRDGLWHNGTGYFPANVKTLAYMPLLFSYVARFDFLQHPWYRNAGRALAYTNPPESKSAGFGDSSESGDEPNRLTAAFADYLAREISDSYAGWYAGQCSSLVQSDYELRLYRMCSTRTYETSLPESTAKMVWHHDTGEVSMHSHLGDTDNDLALEFRSSTFGSGSHTTASQNAFNLLFKGHDVYRSTGYYQAFADAHNLMSYRHSRAHNTILVNGIGQPYSTEGYGYIARALGGSHISYALGDASNAYSGISEDPMWISYFAQAGIEQTPENGFGETPLTKYRRHVLMLHPRTVVIYDELEASEPVRWDWLLHSPTEFRIEESDRTLSTSDTEGGFFAVTQLFSDDGYSLSQTDQFVVPPAITGPEYPDQWHLTACTDGTSSTRYLAIIQVGDSEEDSPQVIRRTGNTFTIGDWTIEAELDAALTPLLNVTHRTEEVTFRYAGEASTLYDEVDGVYQLQEMADQLPTSTRNVQ